MKQLSIDTQTPVFAKQYPKIINQLCGTGLECLSFPNKTHPELRVLADILFDTRGRKKIFKRYIAYSPIPI